MSFWPFQELFLKVDAGREAAQCFAGSEIPLPAFPGVRDNLGQGQESPLCGYDVYKQEKNPAAKWKPAVYTGESSLPEASEHSKPLSWADGIPTPQKLCVLTKPPFSS